MLHVFALSDVPPGVRSRPAAIPRAGGNTRVIAGIWLTLKANYYKQRIPSKQAQSMGAGGGWNRQEFTRVGHHVGVVVRAVGIAGAGAAVPD